MLDCLLGLALFLLSESSYGVDFVTRIYAVGVGIGILFLDELRNL